ncbi:RTA1 like protein-domain-containing protein [Aspergillus nidulans var. acristatus]
MPSPTQVSAPAPTITAPCTPETCPLDWALIRYFPNLAGNILYLALFALMLLAQVYQGLRFRTWSYLGCMACGTLLEVIGYGGRLILHNNPFNFSAFLQYLICLTIGPAFITAAIYLSFGRVIIIYGEKSSRLRAKSYAKIFVACDLLCLVLQAAGGAVTATAGRNQDGLRRIGINVMIAGLAAQVVCLGTFMVLAGDYVRRLRGLRTGNYAGPDSAASAGSIGGGWIWKGFLWGLGIATLLIFIRSIFRVAELNGGFGSELANDEVAFMILEGAMMVIACGWMSLFHPGLCLRRGDWKDPSSWALTERTHAPLAGADE